MIRATALRSVPVAPRPQAGQSLACSETGAASGAEPISFGPTNLDTRLHGGLARAALHEVFADADSDGSAAAAFALLLALRALGPAQTLLWVRDDRAPRSNGTLHAPGLVELGCDPARLIMVTSPDALGVLRAGLDGVRCGQLGAILLELHGAVPRLDLTASRRLAMAAAQSGVFTLLLRVDATPVPSAAQTRWSVACAPSAPLASAPLAAAPLAGEAPGHPAFDIALLRHRGGIAPFNIRLEWNRDRRSFAPLSGGASSLSAVGTDQAQHAA